MDTALQAGDVLQGRYEIRRPLRAAPGKTVYLAHDRDLDCEVALDVFSDNAAIMPGGLPVHAWEAKVLGRLGDHPNIATVLNHWDDGDTAVMVTRYLPGGSLCDLVARAKDSGGDLPVPDILRISLEIAHGLAHIHKRRILYLDLQPRNVLFDEWGTVRLVDFDTAVLVDQAQRIDLSDRPGVEYLAPELTDGKDPDERSDLYSIYEMAAGHAPFTGTPEEILAARRAAPPSPERTDLPGALRDLILSLLALQPDHRPASAAEVGKRLDDLRTAREEIEWLLASDESARLEFKSSLRVPLGPPPPGSKKTAKELERDLEFEVLKTLAAFLNTDGGTLIIGVADDGTVVGIEVDFPRVRQSRDGWRKTFDNLVSRDLGAEVMKCIDLQLEPWEGHTIAVIRCTPRKEPTWIGDDLYVRRTASTENLSARHAVAWWRERWAKSP
jgi:serine/threonine protein kinase